MWPETHTQSNYNPLWLPENQVFKSNENIKQIHIEKSLNGNEQEHI